MKKLVLAMGVVAFAMIGVVITPNESAAIPSFARQTGNACLSCHFQHIPKLGAMGRAFKLGGYTDASVDLVEDDNLSIPAVMPVSLISDLSYQVGTARNESQPEKKGIERGEWQIPSDATIMMGGRVGANVGYVLDFGAGGWENGKIIFKKDIGDNVVGLSVYSTEMAGAAYGMEVFNTVYMMQKSFIHGRATSASIAVGPSVGAAQGLTVYASGANFFAAAGLFAPVKEAADGGLDLSVYYRVALTGEIAGGDAMIGVSGDSGSTQCVECAEAGPAVDSNGDTTGALQEFKTESFGVDAQWQGEFDNGMTLELLANYSSAPSTQGNIWKEANAFGISADLGLNPEWVLKAGYLTYTDKSGSSDVDTTATTLGVLWNIYQNLTLRVENSIFDGDGRMLDNLTTVTLLSGF